jgi:hypothetical protein
MTKLVTRADFITIKGPRSHENCMALTGVMRPGKTRADKANGSQRFHKNRRVWDGSSRSWVKA